VISDLSEDAARSIVEKDYTLRNRERIADFLNTQQSEFGIGVEPAKDCTEPPEPRKKQV
jgi:hypothetical protein